MENKDYKKKIEIARKAIDGLNLDESQKLKAFEMVLADLLENKKNKNLPTPTKPKKSKNIKTEEVKEDITDSIEAKDFPNIHKFSKTLDRALYILKIVRDKLNIDGLISSQIAKILTERFRIKSNQFVVSMALMKAKEYVDRQKIVTRGGVAYTYKIMKAGEDYLEKVLEKMASTSNAHSDEEDTTHESS